MVKLIVKDYVKGCISKDSKGWELTPGNLFTKIIFKIFGKWLSFSVQSYLKPPQHINCRCNIELIK